MGLEPVHGIKLSGRSEVPGERGAGQMLGAMALAIASAGLREREAPAEGARERYHDLGNLLLMYVMVWAYLAYTQFLIVWAADLPREIAWYLPRVQTDWKALGVFLIVFHFFVPVAILLSRDAKRSPAVLGSVAAAVLAAHAADVYWLVAPSLRPHGFAFAWTDPLALLVFGALWLFAWRPERA